MPTATRPVPVFIIILLLAYTTLLSQDYVWPTDAGTVLTSSFGEYRAGHFHAGIDVKTWGITGYQVFSIASGSVVRVRTSPFGYGKVVYVRHDNGWTTVYGHLKDFSPPLQEIIREEQRKRGRYTVDKWLETGVFRVEPGSLLGYTGRSGTRHPHLHFEVRDNQNRPFNPLMLGFPVKDSIEPTPVSVAVSPMTADSHVNGDFIPRVYSLQKKSKGKYRISETITGWGTLGLSLNAYDRADGGSNKFAIQTLRLFIDNEQIFAAEYDRFSFNNTFLVDMDRDYRLNAWGAGLFQKLYVDDGNSLPFYTTNENQGLLTAGVADEDAGHSNYEHNEHLIRIECIDFFGNTSEIYGLIRTTPLEKLTTASSAENAGNPFSVLPVTDSLELDIMTIDDRMRFLVRSGDAELQPSLSISFNLLEKANIPLYPVGPGEYSGMMQWPGMEDGLLIATASASDGVRIISDTDTLRLFLVTPERGGEVISEGGKARLKFSEHSVYQPVIMNAETVALDHEAAVIPESFRFQPADFLIRRSGWLTIHVPGGERRWSKTDIYRVKGSLGASPLGGIWHDDRITARVGSPGTYAVLRDTVSPVLRKVVPGNGSRLANTKPRIAIEFEDKLSGIDGEENYRVCLNGRPLIMEFDPVYDTAHHYPHLPLENGDHELVVVLRDRAGNETRWTGTFTISAGGQP